MRKKSSKTLIALFGIGLLFSQSASAISLPGFGGKKTRTETLQAQLKKAPLDKALSMSLEDQKNDSDAWKCNTKTNNPKSLSDLIKMYANGCLPAASKHDSTNEFRRVACAEHCANISCDRTDPDGLKKFCGVACSTAYLGDAGLSNRRQKCFSQWGKMAQPDADTWKNMLKGWKNPGDTENPAAPLSHKDSQDYFSFMKERVSSEKISSAANKEVLGDYKIQVAKLVSDYVKYLAALEKSSKTMKDLETTFNVFKKEVKKSAKLKQNLEDGKVSISAIESVEKAQFKNLLPKGKKDSSFTLPAGTDSALDFIASEVDKVDQEVSSIITDMKGEAGQERTGKKIGSAASQALISQKMKKRAAKARGAVQADRRSGQARTRNPMLNPSAS